MSGIRLSTLWRPLFHARRFSIVILLFWNQIMGFNGILNEAEWRGGTMSSKNFKGNIREAKEHLHWLWIRFCDAWREFDIADGLAHESRSYGSQRTWDGLP